MMRQRSILLLGAAAVLVFAACASDSGDSEKASGGRKFLSVGTAPPGGAFFVVGSAIAEVLDANAGDNGWSVTAEATKGSQENIRRITAGEIELALVNSAISYYASRGSEQWGEAADIRALTTLAPNVALFIAPEGGPETIADHEGLRVPCGPDEVGMGGNGEPDHARRRGPWIHDTARLEREDDERVAHRDQERIVTLPQAQDEGTGGGGGDEAHLDGERRVAGRRRAADGPDARDRGLAARPRSEASHSGNGKRRVEVEAAERPWTIGDEIDLGVVVGDRDQ